jgi:hypothetical protein
MPLPDDPILNGLLAFWEQARGGRPMPAKADVDPLRLGARLLPFILLIDRVAETGRYRYRLCGSANAEAAGVDLTGLHVDELNPNPDYIAYMTGLYRRSLETARPVYSESRYMPLRSDTIRGTRRLICPLSDDGTTIDRFISAQTFQQLGQIPLTLIGSRDRFESGLVEVL